MAGYHVDYRTVDGVCQATQEVDDLDISTGSFAEVISKLQKDLNYWQNKIGKPHRCRSRYADGEHDREVVFDEFEIDSRYINDGDESAQQFFIVGKRKAIAEEIAALEKQADANKEWRRKQYEQLKGEFGG